MYSQHESFTLELVGLQRRQLLHQGLLLHRVDEAGEASRQHWVRQRRKASSSTLTGPISFSMVGVTHADHLRDDLGTDPIEKASSLVADGDHVGLDAPDLRAP